MSWLSDIHSASLGLKGLIHILVNPDGLVLYGFGNGIVLGIVLMYIWKLPLYGWAGD